MLIRKGYKIVSSCFSVGDQDADPWYITKKAAWIQKQPRRRPIRFYQIFGLLGEVPGRVARERPVHLALERRHEALERGRGLSGDLESLLRRPAADLVERFDIEPSSDFSAK